MTVRTALLLSFIAGVIFGAVGLWLFEEPQQPSGPVAKGDRTRSVLSQLEACSEDLERARFELTRECGPAAKPATVSATQAAPERETTLEESTPEPPSGRRRRRGDGSGRPSHFDAAALQAIGFAPNYIEWVQGRWELAEVKAREFYDLKARGEAPLRGGDLSDTEQELREDLGDDGYDAMLYATHQKNRVVLQSVRRNSIAYRAGIRDGNVVWSYDGQRVFESKELAALSTSGNRGEPVEIVIVTEDGTEQYTVERNPLGAEFIAANKAPKPN
jgi:hypothetical protein